MTSKIVHETEFKYTTVGIDGVTRQIDALLKLIDTLPTSGKKSNETVQGIVNSLKALKDVGLDKSLGSDEARKGVKEVQNQLKALTTISKALELFKDSDLQKSKAQAKSIRDIESAYKTLLKSSQLQDGSLGLGAATAKEAKTAETALKAHLANKAKMLKEAQAEYNKLARQERNLSSKNQNSNQYIPLGGFAPKTDDVSSKQSVVQARLSELKLVKAELSQAMRLHQQNLRNLTLEQDKVIQQKLRDAEAKNQAKGTVLNDAGARATEYQKIKAQEKGDYLRQWTERKEELRRRAIEEARQTQEYKAQAELAALNQAGARQAELQRRAIEQKRQVEEAAERARLKRLNEEGSRQTQYRQIQAQERGGLFQQAQERQMSMRNSSVQSIYKDHLLSVPSLTASVTANTKVRDLTAQIVSETNKLVELRRTGQSTLQNEAKALERIGALAQKRNQEVSTQNTQDRAKGERGASLLVLQAALMQNYSIINTVTGSIRAAISVSVELEAAFRNIQAVTATSNTEMRGLEATIKNVAASSKFSSLEVAQAALTLGQAGLNAKQVGEALGSVVTLASAAGTSIAQAVDLVTSIIGVFDKKATDVADIANKITQAANSSKVSVEKLALGLQYAGNTAAQMGITFEETVASMAAMSNAGIKNGSTMGTGLRSFLTELQKPSESFVQTLSRIGLSVADLDVKTYGLIGVTKRLREAGFTATDAMKSFDIRSASAFNAMVGNPEEMERQYRLLLQTAAGVEANAIQMDSLKSQSSRLTTSLGNLASTGLMPLSKLLTTISGGLATMVQLASENQVAVGILGTAVAALVTGGLAGYLGSVAIGFKTMLPMVNIATFSVAGLTVAFKGLSFAMGIGLVVAGLTAAFSIYQYTVNGTAKEIDRLKAASSEAKGALEEKEGTISSLSKKIEELNYKQSTLTTGSEALKTAALEVTSQFGHLGYQADQNNVTFETMIGRLKGLKTAMENVRLEQIRMAQTENQNLLKAQTDDLQGSVKDFTGDNGPSQRSGWLLQKLLTSNKSGLNPEEKQVVTAALKELQSGNLDGLSNVGNASQILSRKVAANTDPDSKGFLGDSRGKDLLKTLSEDMAEIARKNLSRITTQGELSVGEAHLEKINAWDRYNNSGDFGKGADGKNRTWEEYRDKQVQPGALSSKALQSSGMDAAKGPVNQMALFEEMKKQYQVTQTFYQKELERADKLQKNNPLAAQKLRADIKSSSENLKGEFLQQANVTQGAAKRKYGDDTDFQDQVQKGEKNKGNKEGQIKALEEKARLEIEFETRTKTDENEIYDIRKAINKTTQQKIENVRDKKQGGHHTDPMDGIAERTAAAQAIAAERQSKAAMDSTKSVASMEELDEALDLAIAKQIEAKGFRAAALLAKHEGDKKRPGYQPRLGELNYQNEVNALEDDQAAKLESLRNSLIALYETTAKRLDTTRKYIVETKQQMESDKIDGEDRLFEANQVPKALDSQLKYHTASAVSLSVRQEVVRRRNEANLAAIELELKLNQQQLDSYGDESEGFLAKLREAYLDAEEAVKIKEAQLSQASPKDREELTAKLAVDKRMSGESFTAYRDGKNNQSRLRSEHLTLTDKRNEAAQNLPLPDTLNSYGQKIDEVFGKYKNNVAEMDVVGVLGKGLEATLNGLTDQFSDMFTSIASGSKTVSAAFKDLSRNVIQSILQMITKMLVMKMVQAGLNLMGVPLPVGAIAGGMDASTSLPIGGNGYILTATGGYFTPEGGVERVRKMASGGPITGGIQGKDSVPVLAMPGEFMVNKRAVDAVGTDFLHGLNSASNSVVSQSTASSKSPAKEVENAVVNVYVVTPDQKPSGMGPKDVVVAISDDIMRGGSIKQLIKRVQTGSV